MLDVFIGWDPRETIAADVCRFSILNRTNNNTVNVHDIRLDEIREKGLYNRRHDQRDGQLWDEISNAPMSTEFAISRFLTPLIANTDWAVFCDCDFLWLDDINHLLALADEKYAVMCVKHHHVPSETHKMDAQAQTKYHRKNWSSMVLWNTQHDANRQLTLKEINELPGRDLHRFCWLQDSEIGEIPVEWNWLEGISDPAVDPKVIHYTRGGPWFPEWKNVAYADQWNNELNAMREAA